MKHLKVVFSALLVLVLTATVVAAAPVFPSVIPLPDGFAPEGIVAGNGPEAFVGSLATGAIYRADLRTGAGAVLVPPQTDGRIAVGLAFDARTNYIYAAGGPGGAGYVYDAGTGASVAVVPLSANAGFVNDVVVTREAVYFTDSFQPVLYKIALLSDGTLPAQPAVEVLPLGGDFTFVPGAFNANGIDATPNGKSLVIVNSGLGTLYTVNPETGEATLIDLGGDAVPNGDGILLDGKTLYVVQNQLNQIAKIQLAPDFSAGTVVDLITDSDFRVPTTVTEFGSRLYAVNARFGLEPGPFDIVQVGK